MKYLLFVILLISNCSILNYRNSDTSGTLSNTLMFFEQDLSISMIVTTHPVEKVNAYIRVNTTNLIHNNSFTFFYNNIVIPLVSVESFIESHGDGFRAQYFLFVNKDNLRKLNEDYLVSITNLVISNENFVITNLSSGDNIKNTSYFIINNILPTSY